MSDTRQQLTRTSRRIAAPFLILATIAVLAAGILPTCRVNCCSSLPTIASVHANMPCCAPETSIAPRDFDRPHPAALAGSFAFDFGNGIGGGRKTFPAQQTYSCVEFRAGL